MSMASEKDHPGVRDIIACRWGGGNDGSARETAGHIAACGKCREIYRSILRIEDCLAAALPEGEPSASCPGDWEIASTVLNEAGGEAQARITSHLQECPHCLDRAATLQKAVTAAPFEIATPPAWKQEAKRIHANHVSGHAGHDDGVFRNIGRFFRDLVPHLPPLPGYVTAIVAIALLVWVSAGRQENWIVVPSTEKIVFREDGSAGSMGFMGAQEEHPVSGMRIVRKGGVVMFRWIPIEEGTVDTLRIVNKSTGDMVFRKDDFPGNEVSIPEKLLEDGKVYVWTITGRTKDGRIYEFSGEGFLRKS